MSTPKRTAQSEAAHYVVGIGASAGGLEALQRFFDAMPEDDDLAFVVIQHLSPDYKSLMVELLSKHTRMQVKRSEDGMSIQPNTVYLIPPKMNMAVLNGKLLLTEQPTRQGLNLPIDIFMRSLADDFGEKAIGVVLSGTGSDGSRGIRTIKEAGGMIMVQDEASARFNGMPSAAIQTGLADYVLPPEEMPGQLLKYVNHPLVNKREPVQGDTREENIARIVTILRRHTGVDFSCYKPTTVLRRIERRMGIVQIDDLDDYTQYLYQSQTEIKLIYRDLLIGVTKFFRDSEAFDILRDQVIPQLFKRRPEDGLLRIWVVGCSTGEEAYSIAMLLQDYIDRSDTALDFKLFATDIDKTAIDFASLGIYPESIAADVPTDFLTAYFDQREGGYVISRQIRDHVIFATQNILKDPPFTRIDLVTCRNMLIYLKTNVQQRVLSLLHFSLRPDGHLLLGSSETVGDLNEAFETVDSKWRIYAKRSTYSPALAETLHLPSTEPRTLARRFTSTRQVLRVDGNFQDARLAELVQANLIEAYAPTCLVVTSELSLIHTYGRRLPFLAVPPGRATLHVPDLVPKELALAITTAAKKVLQDPKPLVFNAIRVPFEGQMLSLDLRIERGPEEATSEPVILILLKESETKRTPTDGESFDVESTSTERIADLERELQYNRENLQATIEELETSNEELQATNEELLAANEELQSTNEELESVNEELYTVNSEYQSKITELTELNNDMDNLLRSSGVGIIFLDRSMAIRKFTPAVTRDLPLREADLGRPLKEISHPLIPSMINLANSVLDSGQPREETVESTPGQWQLIAISPYQTERSSGEGTVINLIDVTPMRRALEQIDKSRAEVDAILQSIEVGVCVTDLDGCFVRVNPAYCRIYGYEESELIGKSFTLVLPKESRDFAQKAHDQFIETGHEIDSEWTVKRKDGSKIQIHATAALVGNTPESRQKVTVVTNMTRLLETRATLAESLDPSARNSKPEG